MKYTPTFILLLISLNAISQVGLEVSGSYNTYAQKDLKKLQTDVKNSLSFPAKATESFPAFFGFEGGISKYFKNMKLGGFVFYTTTGGRLSYADYSGVYVYDQDLEMLSVGLNVKSLVVNKERANFGLGVKLGLALTNYNESERFELYNVVQNQSKLDLKSNGFSLRIYAGTEIKIFKMLHLNTEIGYEVNASSEFKYQGKDTNIKPNWSGLRLAMGFLIR